MTSIVSLRRDASAAADPMSATLTLVSAEIAAIADAAEALQLPIVQLILRAGPDAAASHPELQNLDLMTQALKALALFTARLADGAERGRAAQGLELADLAARLSGEAAEEPPAEAGACVFFSD
jgi:hypothetical protein